MIPYQTVLELIGLGMIAGLFPVYLGIAMALLINKVMDRTWETCLIGLTTGILAYLFFDLMHEAVALTSPRDLLSWSIFAGSVCLSFVGLAALERHQHQRKTPVVRPLFLSYMIAIGLGLHNLGEGLAIGASYAQGQWVLSGLLVGGFALHNGTEGFGIMWPAGRVPVKWRDLGLLGLLAGAPTCMGTVTGAYVVSTYFSLLSYTLAAGSLFYVIVSLAALPCTREHRLRTAIGIFTGLIFMYVTGMMLMLLIGGDR